MMQFTFESPKQFKRITTRLQRVFQSPDIWFPWNSEEETIKIKSVSSRSMRPWFLQSKVFMLVKN